MYGCSKMEEEKKTNGKSNQMKINKTFMHRTEQSASIRKKDFPLTPLTSSSHHHHHQNRRRRIHHIPFYLAFYICFYWSLMNDTKWNGKQFKTRLTDRDEKRTSTKNEPQRACRTKANQIVFAQWKSYVKSIITSEYVYTQIFYRLFNINSIAEIRRVSPNISMNTWKFAHTHCT